MIMIADGLARYRGTVCEAGLGKVEVTSDETR